MKKIKSTFFCLFLSLFVLSCLFCFSPVASSHASATRLMEANILTAEYLEQLNKSTDIYPKTIAHFFKQQSTTKVENQSSISYSTEFTDNFGGIFLDENGILNLQYIQNDDDNLNDLDGSIKLHNVCFSYNYLQSIQNYLSLKMEFYNISSIDIVQKENKIHIYITNNSKTTQNRILSYLNAFDIQAKNAIVFKSAPVENEAFSKVAQAGTEIWYNYGFLNLYKISGTICANVVRNGTGEKGILTNAHVAEANKTMRCKAGKINKSNLRQLGGSIDAAFVPFPNNTWILDDSAYVDDSTTYGNVHYNGTQYIVEGYPVIKLGLTTGKTTGTILSTSTTSTFSNSNGDSFTLNDLIKISNQGDHGDSGGPIYYNGGPKGNKNLIAMTVGGSSYTYGCKIANIVSALNLTIITAQNINNY